MSPVTKKKTKKSYTTLKISFFSILIFAVVLVTAYLLFKDRLMIRSPLLILKNPKVTFVLGDAFYRSHPATPWKKIFTGLRLSEKTEVKTLKNSKLDLHFNSGTTIRLTGNSYLLISQLDIRAIQVHLSKGNVYGHFHRMHQKQKIQIRTPSTVVGIRGTELGIEIVPEKNAGDDLNTESARVSHKGNETVFVYTLSGITEVFNLAAPEKKILLSYQQGTSIKGDTPPLKSTPIKKIKLMTIRKILNAIHEEEVLFISEKIFFEFNRAHILKKSSEELKKIAKLIQKNGVKIKIIGHTDNIGDASTNQILSEQRALAVKKHLIKLGIKPKMLLISAYGASRPVADNETEEGRQKNRRVEFIVAE